MTTGQGRGGGRRGGGIPYGSVQGHAVSFLGAWQHARSWPLPPVEGGGEAAPGCGAGRLPDHAGLHIPSQEIYTDY